MKVHEILTEAHQSNRDRIEKKWDREILRRDWARWKRLVNMPTALVRVIAGEDDYKKMGMTPRELKTQMQFTMPKHAAKAILRLRGNPLSQWNTNDINWMYRILRYIEQKQAHVGPYMDEGKPTERLKNLWAWGHVPRGLRPKKLHK